MTEGTARTAGLAGYALAGLVTAVVPSAAALGVYWSVPGLCDASGGLCLTFLILLVVAPIAALALPVLVFVGRRRGRRVGEGWGSLTLVTGLGAQVLATCVNLFLQAAYLFDAPVWPLLVLPHGFLAGALVGTVFWISARWLLPEAGSAGES